MAYPTTGPVTANGTTAAAARSRIDRATVHAPHLLIAEIGSAARRPVASSRASAPRGLALVEGAMDVADQLHPHGGLVRLTWTLRVNITFDDGLYVALAATLGRPLLTADARLARAPGLPCEVQLVD